MNAYLSLTLCVLLTFQIDFAKCAGGSPPTEDASQQGTPGAETSTETAPGSQGKIATVKETIRAGVGKVPQVAKAGVEAAKVGAQRGKEIVFDGTTRAFSSVSSMLRSKKNPADSEQAAKPESATSEEKPPPQQ